MGLGIIGVVLAAGSLNLRTIIAAQAEQGWYIFVQPLGFVVFLVASFAEAARLPFICPKQSRNSLAATTPNIRA